MAHYQQNKWQAGAALISALFITALCAMFAVALAVDIRLLINNTQLITISDQAYLDLQGIQDWAVGEITIYEKQFQVQTKQPTLVPIKTTFGPRKFLNAVLTGIMQDQQGLFNINDLVQSANQPQFIRLLRAVDPSISTQHAFEIAQAITAWLTPNATDDYYLNLEPPYRAAHSSMVDISELRAVKGITAKLFLELKPFITAIPMQSGKRLPININTAPALVLLALSSKMTVNQAEQLVMCRLQHGDFSNVDDYNRLCVAPLGLSALSDITTQSRFFKVRGQANINGQQVVLTSFLVATLGQNNTIVVHVSWQALN